eukprot:4057837-Pleurochrysis_carterae.AAC.3
MSATSRVPEGGEAVLRDRKRLRSLNLGACTSSQVMLVYVCSTKLPPNVDDIDCDDGKLQRGHLETRASQCFHVGAQFWRSCPMGKHDALLQRVVDVAKNLSSADGRPHSGHKRCRCPQPMHESTAYNVNLTP